MPLLFIYLLKLSVSLSVMYLFYQLLLRRLTFYNHNRWYLVGYSLLCFFIPFINISSALEKNETVGYDIVTFIPSVENFATKVSPLSGLTEAMGGWTIWSWLMIILIAGAAIMLVRLALQFFSFKKIKRIATLIADDDIKFYQVDKNIIPFSFGNSIFINQQLHTETELKEIIRHEFVHVKQRHTIDIIWAEVLCMLNWYNPFAWLIRKAIRQNLEFIADNKVLENGVDKKKYQYLLLKVIGNSHFSIASNFNFSSLKKRITMMNKMKTARVHILRFFFMLPLIAIAVLAFRKEEQSVKYAVIAYDAETLKPIPNVLVKGIYSNVEYTTDAKGYIEIPASVDKDNKMHISYDFIKEGYIKWWNRKFETDFKNNRPNSVIELISLKKGADNGFCDICGAASQSYGSSGVKLSLEEDAWKFFKLLMKVKKNQVTITNTISNISSIDTIPERPITNNKGYYIDINDNKGNCMIILKNKDKKEVKRLLLTEWNKNEKYYKELYGDIPSPPKSKDIKKEQANSENEDALIHAKAGDYLITAQKIIVEDKSRNGGLDSVSVVGFPNGANSLNLKDFNGLVLIDGKEVASEELNKIKADEIFEISIYKKTAVEKYGEKGKNGIVIITTKKQRTDNPQTAAIRIRGGAGIAENAAYYVNGKETSKEAVELIDPAKIQSINVLKGNSAQQKYGEKGKNGVIEITITGSTNINFIEKPPITPAWDIKNVLPGKKKDEC